MPLHTFRLENVFLTKLALFTTPNNPTPIPGILYSTIPAPAPASPQLQIRMCPPCKTLPSF